MLKFLGINLWSWTKSVAICYAYISSQEDFRPSRTKYDITHETMLIRELIHDD